MCPVDKVIALAESQIGYLEKASNAYLDDFTRNAGAKNYTKYARDLDKIGFFNTPKQGAEWCTSFVAWCFVQTFGAELAQKALYLPPKSLGAGCKYAIEYYQRHNAYHKTPQRGDQMFLLDKTLKKPAHTGLVADVKNGMVYTIEGNTSGVDGVVANGGGVFGKSYKLTYKRIAGYGRPDWSVCKAEDEMTVQEIVDRLTPAQCYEILTRANNHAGVLPAPGWADEEIDTAMDDGITDGTKPMSMIPRYQAAMMADRAYKRAIRDVMNMLNGE